MEEIRFDNIKALQAKISDEFGPFGKPFEITQKMIDDFAALTGDHQWIHVDVERAKKESPFGTTIAHGFLILSMLPSLQVSSGSDYKIIGYGNAVNYGSDKLRFTSPVLASAKVHGRARLCGVEVKPAGTQVTQEIAVHVVGSERPALLYQLMVLYQAPRK
jgi:acyl dehydratase